MTKRAAAGTGLVIEEGSISSTVFWCLEEDNLSLIVQKYGGTSVGNVERIKNVAKRVAKTKKQGHDVVVVLSAMSGKTDKLIVLAGGVSSNPDEREMDMLLSTGERVTIALLAMALKDLNVDAVSFTGRQSGIITDDAHTRARIKSIDAGRIRDALSKNKVAVVAGFQGITEEQDVSTLGRGGSDLRRWRWRRR